MEVVQGVPVWQVVTLLTVFTWLRFSSLSSLTVRIRQRVQPSILRQVQTGTQTLLSIQRHQNGVFDAIFATASSVVSVEFYTAFLPLLFWSGHGWLARQMTFLMAVCIYVGNCIKDVVSAPRPPSPPVRRLMAIHCEEESAMEFGLPSSHTINTICLSIYLFSYLTTETSTHTWWLLFTTFSITIFLVAFGRLYLGMHTPVDVIAGIPIAIILVTLWCFFDDYIDEFLLKGENVIPFCTSMSLLLLFAYPRPAHKTPSFEFHTAFNGVVLGVVWGTQRVNCSQENEVVNMKTMSDILTMVGRLVIGFPVVLIIKSISKATAVKLIPMACRLLHIPIRSSSYIDVHKALPSPSPSPSHSPSPSKEENLWLKLLPVEDGQREFDVDTGIRLIQYAALGWSVAELVPCIFHYAGI